MLPLLLADDFGGLLTEGSFAIERGVTILTTSALIDQFVADDEIDRNARWFQCVMWTLMLLRPTIKAIFGARIAKQI